MIFSRADLPGLHGTTRELTRGKPGAKSLPKGKFGQGDIVIIDQPDMSRATAQQLIDAHVAAVVNVAEFTTGQVPNFGPQMLLDADIILVENADPAMPDKVKNGKKGRLYEGKVFYGERSIGGGNIVDMDMAVERFDSARDTLADHMEALSGNTAEFVRTEAPLLVDGLGIPDVDVDMNDRKVLVVSPTPDLKGKINDLRYFLREYDPVIIAVAESADALMKLGLRPRVIVGDPENVDSATLRSGASVIIPAEPDGYARGLERIQDLGVGAMTFPAATDNATDLALLLADYQGASMVVHIGEPFGLDQLFSQAGEPETASIILTRQRVGTKLVDSAAVAELYRVSRSASGPLWAILGVLLAIGVIIAIAGFSGDGSFVDNLINSWNNLALSFQDLFK